jgi:hypothetical protein
LRSLALSLALACACACARLRFRCFFLSASALQQPQLRSAPAGNRQPRPKSKRNDAGACFAVWGFHGGFVWSAFFFLMW